jgi:hypothetical protein
MHSAFIRKFVAFITGCGGERLAGSCCSSYARLYSFTASGPGHIPRVYSAASSQMRYARRLHNTISESILKGVNPANYR